VLRLPAAPADADSVRDPDGMINVPVSAADGFPVLVVDDNADAAALLAESLSLRGHQVRVASDGPAALAALSDFVPVVAVLDIGLPGMDGYELAAHLRADGRLSGLRLVAVTGYGQVADRVRAGDSGFDAHLVKPVDIEDLDRVLREVRDSSG